LVLGFQCWFKKKYQSFSTQNGWATFTSLGFKITPIHMSDNFLWPTVGKPGQSYPPKKRRQYNFKHDFTNSTFLSTLSWLQNRIFEMVWKSHLWISLIFHHHVFFIQNISCTFLLQKSDFIENLIFFGKTYWQTIFQVYSSSFPPKIRFSIKPDFCTKKKFVLIFSIKIKLLQTDLSNYRCIHKKSLSLQMEFSGPYNLWTAYNNHHQWKKGIEKP